MSDVSVERMAESVKLSYIVCFLVLRAALVLETRLGCSDGQNDKKRKAIYQAANLQLAEVNCYT